MIEAYKIGVSLLLDTNINGILAGALRDFERLEKAVQSARTSAQGLTGALRQVGAERQSVAAMAASMDKMASAMERMATAAPTAASATAGMASQAANVAREYQSAAASAERVAKASSGPSVSGGPRPLLLTYDPPGGRAMVDTGRGYNWGSQQYGPFASQDPRWSGGGRGGGGGRGFDYPVGFPEGDEPFGGNGPIDLMRRSGGHGPAPHDYAMAGIGAAAVGYGSVELLRSIFEPGMEAESIKAQMRAARFTDAQVEEGSGLARSMVRSVPGLTYAQGLDVLRQTTAFTGDFDEAFALTPTLARNAQVLSQYGKGDAITQIEKAVQAGELTGLTGKDGKINLDKLTDFVNRLTAVEVSSGGTLNLSKYLTGVRQFGVGADAASLDFTTAVLPAYMKIMGEARAGTALSSFQQSLLSTKPNTQNKSYIDEQKRIGIRDEAGEVNNREQLASNTSDWITQFLLPQLYRHGFSSPTAIKDELYKMLPRQTMTRLAAAGIFDEGIVTKEADRNRAQIAAGTAPFDKLLQDSPQNQVSAFGASLKLLETTLADPNMGGATMALKDLTGALNAMSDWAKANPGMARVLIDVAAALGVVGTVAGGLLLAVGPLIALRKVLGAGIPGLGALGLGPRSGVGLARAGALGALGPLALGAGIAYGIGSAIPDPLAEGLSGKTNYGGALHAVNPWASGPGFNLFDRSTWGNPDGNMFTAHPKVDATLNTHNGPIPVTVTNGRDLANGISDHQARQSTLPGSGGPNGFDTSTVPTTPGMIQ